jgi:hypothetical protein
MLKKALLACGIVSSLWYVAMDIVGSLRHEGYSYTDQTISELSAIDAPTRPVLVAMGIAYTVLVIAVGMGVWGSAGPKRALRVVGGLLVGLGVLGFVWPFTPMHQREVLAAGGETLTDTLHLTMAAASSLLFLLAMGFGAVALGKRFRPYSIGTILTLLVFGALTSLEADAVEANDPTPWLGVLERITVYASMLWVAVLAGVLLRAYAPSAPRQAAGPAVTPQAVLR